MKIFPILTMLIGLGFNNPETSLDLHSNIVAHVLIDNYHNDLYAEVYLQKSLLAQALKNEESCSPQEMLRVCGNSYFQKHLNLSLNGELVSFQNQSIDIERDFVIYRYHLQSGQDSINKIEVESDYMLQYDDHSVTKLRIKIDDLEKYYSLKAERKKITFSLQ